MKRIMALIAAFCMGYSVAGELIEGPFNGAIRKAKLMCAIKSFKRELADFKSSMHASKTFGAKLSFINELAASKEIEEYIKRPAGQVVFTERHVPVISNKYEKSLYDIFDHYASYRGLIHRGSFYESPSGQGRGIQEYTKFVLSELVAQGASESKNRIQLNIDGGDMQNLRQSIDEQAPKVTSDCYLISKHYEGGHAFVSVIKYSTQHEPITFLVNSWGSDGYYSSLKGRLNDGQPTARLFVQASFDLQKLNDGTMVDYNCFLYALEFAKAAVQYLQNNDTSQLHADCLSGNYNHAASLLHEGIKSYLPYTRVLMGHS